MGGHVLLSILLFWAASASAQLEASRLHLAVPAGADTQTTIRKDVDEVRLVFTVTEKRGRFVQGLGRDDVRVFDDQRAVSRFTYFQSQSDLPLRIGVLVDVSGSMQEQLGFEGRFTEEFLQNIVRPADSAVILGFNTRTTLIDSGGAAAGLKAFHRREPKAGTAIYDALASSFPMLGNEDAMAVRRVVVLITDGEDNASRSNLRAIIDEALRHEVAVYVVSTAEVDAPRNLKQLAAQTGGWLWHARSVRAMVKAFERVSAALRSQYVLAFRPEPEQLDGRYHHLKVRTVRHGAVHCRAGYFARLAAPRD